MGKIMEELLIKAQRDKSKLVQVQRSVSRNGKTFMQNFWVQPSQVKTTDKVVGGQQNLLPTPGSVPKPAPGVLDKAYFESIKSDHTKAIDYLKSCGVTWNDHSHAGINWMRAMQAYNTALGAQNGTKGAAKTSTQPNSQPSSQTAQSAQNTAGNGSQGVTLTAAQQAQVDAGKNGKEKVVILKKILGNDGCMAYARQLGISWTSSPHAGIDNMRMTMALKAHFDSTDGTVSPTGGKQGGGAPKGNQNAKKDETKKPDDTIKVTASHTPRQAALIGLINGITDPKELELIKSTGIVAEDADAKAFIEKTLKPAYYQNNGISSNRGYHSVKDIAKSTADDINGALRGIPKRVIVDSISDFIQGSDSLNMYAVQHPRDVIAALGKGGSGTSSVGTIDHKGDYNGGGLTKIFRELNILSQLAGDNLSSLGETRESSKEKIEAQFQKFGYDSFGVISTLTHIANGDSSLSSEVVQMRVEYQSMLDNCGHDTELLDIVLKQTYSSLQDAIDESYENKAALNSTIELLRELQSQYNLTDADLAQTLWNMDSWNVRTSGDAGKLTRADGTLVLDAHGNLIDVTEKLNDLGRIKSLKIGYSGLGNWIGNDSQRQFLEAAIVSHKDYDTVETSDFSGVPSNHKYWGGNTLISKRNVSQRYEVITPDKYAAVRNSMLKFGGQKVQRYDGVSDSYIDVDTSTWGVQEWSDFDSEIDRYVSSWSGNKREFRLVSDGDNPEKDTILANLHSVAVNTKFMTHIHDGVGSKSTPSKANDNGNWALNFSYLSPGTSKMYWDSASQNLSADQVNSQIAAQVSNSPVISLETRKKLLNYAESNGDGSRSPSLDADTMRAYKASSLNLNQLASVTQYKDSPVYDIFMAHMLSVAHLCPQIKNTRVKSQEDVDRFVSEKMGFIPYGTSELTSPGDLKSLREAAFAKVHCSLRTADQTQRDAIETRVKQDWDKGKRSQSGRRLYGNISFVGHGVYQIQNSEADEIFRESVKKTGETPQSFFHGTNFKGACGIVGVDGKFRAPKDSVDAAKQGLKYAGGMLGPGVYLADLAGKSAGYFGTWGSGYAHGALLVCDAILGNHATASDYYSVKTRMDVDSVSMKAGTNTGRTVLRADEWCVRRNDYVSPQFIVDAEAVPR